MAGGVEILVNATCIRPTGCEVVDMVASSLVRHGKCQVTWEWIEKLTKECACRDWKQAMGVLHRAYAWDFEPDMSVVGAYIIRQGEPDDVG